MWMMERSPGCCQGSGSIQTGSGTSGDTGLLGMGTPGHSHIHQGRAQSYSPSQQLAGMPAWAHTGYPHTTLRCSAPRGAAFLWQKAGLSPRTKDPQPQPGWGRGPMGICSCESLQQPPTKGLPAGRRKASLAQPPGSTFVCLGQERGALLHRGNAIMAG